MSAFVSPLLERSVRLPVAVPFLGKAHEDSDHTAVITDRSLTLTCRNSPCCLSCECCIQGRIQGGATGGCSPPLSSSDHTPYLHEYPTYSGISNKEVERKLSAGLFPTETACDSQNESDTESTRAGDENRVLSSDHVHGESSSDLTLIGDS